MAGRFIVLEGLDGSGKSTQITLLAQALQAQGRKVHCTAEPTSSATGGLIRDTLSGSYARSGAELAALFLTDRIAHNVDPVRGFRRLLREGWDVVCDRYYYSSFAYQGLSTDLDWVLDMNLNCPDLAKPDLCVFLDVDYRSCKERLDQDRASLEIFERDPEQMNETRRLFLEVFRRLEGRENIRVVDANRSAGEVAEEILQLVNALEICAGKRLPRGRPLFLQNFFVRCTQTYTFCRIPTIYVRSAYKPSPFPPHPSRFARHLPPPGGKAYRCVYRYYSAVG